MKSIEMNTELNLTKWARFKSDRLSLISCMVLLITLFFSLTAEFWANSKPIFLHFQGVNYIPLFKTYHPSHFGQENAFVMDYRSLKLSAEDWVVWPLVKWDPYESNTKLLKFPSPPSEENIFGTDDRGRDLFARLLYGFRYTFLYAFGVWFIAYLLGTVYGSLIGYYGGRLDLWGMRLIEIMDSIPSLLILITLISIFNPNLMVLIGFSVIFGWTEIATYIRAEVLTIRKREFIDGARLIGAPSYRIIWRHILPNALTPLITLSPFSIASHILILTNMDYLGLGLPVPTPSWGELLSQSQKYMTVAEWLVWWPSLFITVTLLSLINIGLGIRDANNSL